MMCDARMVMMLCVAVDLLMGSVAWFIQPAAAHPRESPPHWRQSRHGANLQRCSPTHGA
jgi:hypothetical protein